MTFRPEHSRGGASLPELPNDGGPQGDVGPLVKGSADAQIQCQRAGGFEIVAEHQLIAATALERSFELESDGVVLFKPRRAPNA